MGRAVKHVLLVWLVLMLSTVASTWWFSQPVVAPVIGTLVVMLIAAMKVGLVMSHFMDLRNAPRPWQLAGLAWIVVAAGAVAGIYLS